MKLWGILILVLLSAKLFAQNLNGLVVDKSTKQPVAYAEVTISYISTYTSEAGKFNIAKIHPGDTIRITCMNYKPLKFTYHPGNADTIYLQQISILLRGVSIRAKHDHKVDSIRNRNEFSTIFNYKNPGLKDMFIAKNPYLYVPYNYIDAPNSTASIVSVNLLSLIEILSKNKEQSSKLQKTLLHDEQSNYIERAFSKQKIMAITNLHDDSLQDFMTDYRPTIEQVKKMTDYEMFIYIKTCYVDLKKTYNHQGLIRNALIKE
jgi:hypothetical protein